ncbi:MAG: hypothetical protein Q8K45_20425 [Rubrivivax sp.]|nr:hypothetical protein [Rubrivivax sp.]
MQSVTFARHADAAGLPPAARTHLIFHRGHHMASKKTGDSKAAAVAAAKAAAKARVAAAARQAELVAAAKAAAKEAAVAAKAAGQAQAMAVALAAAAKAVVAEAAAAEKAAAKALSRAEAKTKAAARAEAKATKPAGRAARSAPEAWLTGQFATNAAGEPGILSGGVFHSLAALAQGGGAVRLSLALPSQFSALTGEQLAALNAFADDVRSYVAAVACCKSGDCSND